VCTAKHACSGLPAAGCRVKRAGHGCITTHIYPPHTHCILKQHKQPMHRYHNWLHA
jgi:hypothetical protein